MDSVQKKKNYTKERFIFAECGSTHVNCQENYEKKS